MPRNAAGTFTLVAGNPVLSGTLIESAWANTTLADIETALTDSLSRTGQGGMLTQFLNADGLIGAPGISWTNQPTAGFYRAGSSDFRYAIAASDIYQIVPGSVRFTDGNIPAPGISFINDPSLGIYRAGASAMNVAVAGAAVAAFVANQVRHAAGTLAAPGISWVDDASSGFQYASAGDMRIGITGTMTARFIAGQILLMEGAALSPSLGFHNDTASGWYRGGAQDYRFSVSGTDSFQVALGQARVGSGSATVPSWSFWDDSDCGLWRIGANDIGLTVAGQNQWQFLQGSTNTIGTFSIIRADGAIHHWTNTALTSGDRSGGIHQQADSLYIGKMADNFSAFTQYIFMSGTSERMSAFAAAGFSISNAAMSGELFVFDPVGQQFVSYPSTNDATALYVINGASFKVTRAGSIYNNSLFSAGDSTYSTGACTVTGGNATNTGFVSFLNAAGTRQGYIGFATTGGRITLYSDTTGGWAILNGQHALASDTNGTIDGTQGCTFNVNSPSGSSYNLIAVRNTGGGGASIIALVNLWGAAVAGYISYTSTTTSYVTSSSRELKDDIRELTDSGDIIDRIKPSRFKWKVNGEPGIGFVAEELYDVVPEAVVIAKPVEKAEEPGPDLWGVDASKLMPFVIAELKHLRNRVEQLEL